MSQGVTVLALMLAYDCIHLLRSLALLREAASRHASNAEQSQRNGSSKARASNANGSDTASTAQAQAELQTHRALWLAFAIRCALPIAWGLGYLALRRFIAGQAIGECLASFRRHFAFSSAFAIEKDLKLVFLPCSCAHAVLPVGSCWSSSVARCREPRCVRVGRSHTLDEHCLCSLPVFETARLAIGKLDFVLLCVAAD